MSDQVIIGVNIAVIAAAAIGGVVNAIKLARLEERLTTISARLLRVERRLGIAQDQET